MKLNDDELLQQATDWLNEGKKLALATVVETWGSSPRPAGSHLLICEDGTFIGSVSGGCVEASVVYEANEVMVSGTPRVIEFGVSNERAWEVGLSCGGKIRIFVEPLS